MLLFCAISVVMCVSVLRPFKFTQVALGDIMPTGWLKNQINIQAKGLSGYIDEYWSDVQSSGWLGGWAEGWERFPYYMDGFYALAVFSEDQKLMTKALAHIDYVLSHQTTDGWLGPNPGQGNLGKGTEAKNDPWPQFPLLKCLIQVHSHTKNQTIYDSMMKSVLKIDQVISEQGLDPFIWAKYRLQDYVLVLQYLYDESPTSQLFSMIKKYTYDGYDWFKHFSNFSEFQTKQKFHVGPGSDNLRDHGVNNAQAVKFPAIRYRLDNSPSTSLLAQDWIINKLQKYHGTATGLFHGDELYGGLSPTQGSELCLIVEMMFSLEISLLIIGESWIGDLLEKISYNNLPAVLDQSMNVHQYVHLDNQIMCKRGILTNFTDVGSYGPLYGVAPNYGCCTANMHQGWPKFVSNLWGIDLQEKMVVGHPSIIALVHAPSLIATSSLIKGKIVKLEMITDYPFGNGTSQIRVLSDTFPSEYGICYRVPEWEKKKNNKYEKENNATQGWNCMKKQWKMGDSIDINFEMTYHLSDYSYHDSVSLFRGPLLLSKSIPHKDEKVHKCIDPHDKKNCEDYYDYEKLPTNEDLWNFALEIDREDPGHSVLSQKLGRPGPIPFSRDDPAVVVNIKAAKVPNWKESDAYRIAGEVPYSPVKEYGEIEEIELVPIGSTDLRVSVFPTV